MSIEYMFPNGRSIHYNAFIESLDYLDGCSDSELINSIDSHLVPFKGKIISVKGWRGSVGVLGIEFDTEEDLLYFKLKFN